MQDQIVMQTNSAKSFVKDRELKQSIYFSYKMALLSDYADLT